MSNRYQYLGIEDWKKRTKEDNILSFITPTEDTIPVLRKQSVHDVIIEKEVDSETEMHPLTFVISSEREDRDTDIVSMKGWDLDEWQKNPVVLFGHNSSAPPIATGTKIWKSQGMLKSTAKFTPQDLNPFGYMIYRMNVEGFLKATSVGFVPKQWKWAEDEETRPWGIDFEKQELLEWSSVPVPSNPDALIQMHAMGIDTAPLKQWAEEVLDTHQKGLDRKTVEQAWKITEKNLGNRLITIGESEKKTVVNESDQSFVSIFPSVPAVTSFPVNGETFDCNITSIGVGWGSVSGEYSWWPPKDTTTCQYQIRLFPYQDNSTQLIDLADPDKIKLIEEFLKLENWEDVIRKATKCQHKEEDLRIKSGNIVCICGEEIGTGGPAKTTPDPESESDDIDIDAIQLDADNGEEKEVDLEDLDPKILKELIGQAISEQLATQLGRLPK